MSRPPVLGLGALWHFYRTRLRTQAAQELLALTGIAVGVALIFAVEVANTSVTGSVDKLVRGVTGDAALQVAARGGTGFDASTVETVEQIPGVRIATPALDDRAAIAGPGGQRAIDLIGVTPELGLLRGQLMRGLGPRGVRLSDGLVLPEPLAEAIGVGAGERARLMIDGRSRSVPVTLTVSSDQYGDLAGSPLAIGPLSYVQRISDQTGLISRVLVSTEPGDEQEVEAALERQLGSRLNVDAATSESTLIQQAATPGEQSTALFAGVSALVGGLFAFTAMLLTVPERRRFIAELRLQGFSTSQISTQVAFESLLLGSVAAALGLLLGDQLSRHVFEPLPGSLSFAFPIGDQRVVTLGTVALSFGAGLVATLVAGAQPLLDVFSRQPLDAMRAHGEPAETTGVPVRRGLLLAGVTLVALTTLLALLAPDLTVVAPASLALALVLVLPSAFALLVALCERISRSKPLALLALAATDLRGTRTRSVALAATVALALFGTIAIEGAHRDLLRGLDDGAHDLTATADLWISARAPENTLATMPFDARPVAEQLAEDPRVASVRPYRSAFLDDHGRRLWVIGQPSHGRGQVPPSQVLEGDPQLAAQRLRDGGWAAVSAEVAEGHGRGLGERLTLDTPSGPRSFRLAALLTNVGWGPGTVILDARDFRRAWGESTPSALQVDLRPGVGYAAGEAIATTAIGARPLVVQTAAERWADLRAGARNGLSRLSQIATLALICAIIAVAAAMGAGVWQRRGALAELRVHGFSWVQLWALLLLETGLLLACGGAVGVVFGLYGQALAAHWLAIGTGFPMIYAPATLPALTLLALVTFAAVAVAALPGFAAARTPLRLGFREE
jgi:putative ABC transport system permease protein